MTPPKADVLAAYEFLLRAEAWLTDLRRELVLNYAAEDGVMFLAGSIGNEIDAAMEALGVDAAGAGIASSGA